MRRPEPHILANALHREERIIIEGTQGFGLSVLHGGHYPYATSRDTTAAGALPEAGLSPRDVDWVVLTLRAFPIRVDGCSGPLPLEIKWDEVAHECGADKELTEFTTVTKLPRRVARFHDEVVLRAVRANRPNRVVLNHVDYFDYTIQNAPNISAHVANQVCALESQLALKITHVGTSPGQIIARLHSG